MMWQDARVRRLALFLTVYLTLTASRLSAQHGSVAPPQEMHDVPPAADQGEILVLYGARSEMPAYPKWSSGIRAGLRDRHGQTPTVNVEFLDLTRYDDRQHTLKWLELMRYKYTQRDIRVVIPVFGPALQFATNHLREIFPEAAVVFASIDEHVANGLTDSRDVTGVVYWIDMGKTCELALQLRPRTKHVVCVTGSSPYEQSLVQSMRKQLAAFEERVSIDYWQGLPLEELTGRLQDLPDDHIILFAVYFSDRDGRDYVPAEVATAICSEASVPVFGCYRTLLACGVVGGQMFDLTTQATTAGRMARQVLDGAHVSQLPIVGHDMNQPVVDWRQMQYWQISESNVPPTAMVVNRTPAFWERYRLQIAATLGLVALQFALIVTLLLNRLQRQRAERALAISEQNARRHRDELERVNRISTLGEMTTSIAHEVNQPLFAIVSNAQTGLRLLSREHPDMQELGEALEDIANDGNRAANVIDRVRSLTHKQQPQRSHLAVNDVVREVLALIAPNAEARGIVIQQELTAGLPAVEGDPIQLQQVILNLLINGAQAMRNNQPGTRELIVRTAMYKGSVCLTVQDNGLGLVDDQVKRIFDPFFTTKIGGIGMGLSINRSIVEAHKGRIWATQNPDRGATFHVTLPTVNCDVMDDESLRIDSSMVGSQWSGSDKQLVAGLP